jgi:hypothetical protein
MAKAEVIEKRPNKFNEIFNSANRFVVYKKAGNPFLKGEQGGKDSVRNHTERESARTPPSTKQ